MRVAPQSAVARYGMAAVAVAAAVVLRLTLDPLLGLRFPFATLFFAVLVAAWYGGFGPGLFATLLGTVAAAAILLPSADGTTIRSLENTAGLALNTLVGLGIAGLGGSMRRSQVRAAAAAAMATSQREELRTTLASIGDAVIVTDTAGRVVSVNPVAASLLGWTEPEARGRPLREVFRIINEQTRAPAADPVDRVLASGVVVGLANHTVLVDRNGREIPIDDSAAPVRDASGRLTGVVLVFRDVSERRRAESVRRHLAAIVEGSEDAIVGKDLNGVITSWNAAAERLYGYTASEVIGRPFSIFIPPDRAGEVEEMAARLRRGDRIDHFETVRQRKDGRDIDVSVSYSPIRDSDGQVVGTAVITRDVTEQKQALTALKASEARFAALVNNAPAIIFAKDAEGVYHLVNPRGAENTGFTVEQVLGKTDHELFSKDTADAFRQGDLEVLRTGEVTTVEETFEHQGRRFTYLTAKFPLTDSDGRRVGVCGIAIDITARKEAEETLRSREISARFLADASVALATLTDETSALEKVASLAVPHFADWCAVDMATPGGGIRRVAVAHVDTAKVRLAEEINHRWPPDPAAEHGAPAILRTGKSELASDITDEALVEAIKDPERLAILRQLGLRSYIGVPLTVRGKVLGAITFVAAESGRRYDDADLAAAEDLARRAAIAVENAQLYQALKEADKRKDEFLATLAHELRNPLAPIRNSAHLLRTAPAGSLAVERAREMIERQVHHLVRLVDDLLDVSRVMRGKIELRLERLDVATVAARSGEIAQPLMESRGLKLTVAKPDGAVWVAADPVRLAQTIDNLLTNAAKYSNPGGQVRLAVEPASDGREVVIRVQDTGIGIAPEMLDKVFELFFQVDTTAGRSQGGLGLGLTLVKSLVEMHGGSVAAHSAGLGKGSEFVVRLPAARRGENGRRDVADVSAPGAHGTSRRVLVVDDHADAADSLAMLLTMEGHQVRVARNGPAAVEAVRADPPDVVLLDLGMPGMDGYEVARRLKEELAPPDLLLVALTGWGQDEDRRRTREAGFHHHFVKPVDPNDLRQLLARSKPVRRAEKSPPPTGRGSWGSSQ